MCVPFKFSLCVLTESNKALSKGAILVLFPHVAVLVVSSVGHFQKRKFPRRTAGQEIRRNLVACSGCPCVLNNKPTSLHIHVCTNLLFEGLLVFSFPLPAGQQHSVLYTDRQQPPGLEGCSCGELIYSTPVMKYAQLLFHREKASTEMVWMAQASIIFSLNETNTKQA